MDPRTMILEMQCTGLDLMWSVQESLQQQSEHMIRTWFALSGVPIGTRTRFHAGRWLEILNRSRDDARDSSRVFMDRVESRLIP
ncbi:hypothetical protein LZ24_00908 [Desulfobotulus alkaliphilus]|uniref:Uncharacterized protein n=1 Tax=Desulfobotulus alkaliphilus TaxID=622671 RepID=A0A562RYY2_9BACT|nr:hypothetical protein [Desulfobotulus alkaliphilus]TWI74305.1 hypothetical protein LZ24_00908 [Desulfobotulus alkaliphilus]